MRDAVIVDAVRAPIGRRRGALSGIHPADLSAHVLEALVERTGIVERRISGPGETTCSMAAEASRKAMAKAGVQAGELDAIEPAAAQQQLQQQQGGVPSPGVVPPAPAPAPAPAPSNQ